jgi:hypothetical protein
MPNIPSGEMPDFLSWNAKFGILPMKYLAYENAAVDIPRMKFWYLRMAQSASPGRNIWHSRTANSAFGQIPNSPSSDTDFGIRPEENLGIRECKIWHPSRRRTGRSLIPLSAFDRMLLYTFQNALLTSGRTPNLAFSDAQLSILRNAEMGISE